MSTFPSRLLLDMVTHMYELKWVLRVSSTKEVTTSYVHPMSVIHYILILQRIYIHMGAVHWSAGGLQEFQIIPIYKRRPFMQYKPIDIFVLKEEVIWFLPRAHRCLFKCRNKNQPLEKNDFTKF